jgi:hypothetical protein
VISDYRFMVFPEMRIYKSYCLRNSSNRSTAWGRFLRPNPRRK